MTKKVFNYLIAGLGLLSIFFLLPQCTKNNQPALKEGIWRATLQREDGHQVVFNFSVKDSLHQPVISIFNANGRLRVDSINITGDSVYIKMPFFGSHFTAHIQEDGSLKGTWTKSYGNRAAHMPFSAQPGDSLRLPAYQSTHHNITGSWDATFTREDGSTYQAIGEFKQKGSKVTGTFLTPFGDFRYLQGVVSGDTLKVTGFDGCHALLFTALVDSSNRLNEGQIYSINSDAAPWHAEKKAFDSLPAAYAVKSYQPGEIKTHFNLKDMQTGEMVSLEDSTFKNKVVVLQILGSWCPNCMDETPFMTNYYNKNKEKDIKFLGIDFERTADFDESKKALQSFFDHFDINYPILFSGVSSSDSKLTEKVFPGLPEKIHVFPTTIFLDREGYVRKIHSGFNGPATGKYYDQFKEEFKNIVEGLLKE